MKEGGGEIDYNLFFLRLENKDDIRLILSLNENATSVE